MMVASPPPSVLSSSHGVSLPRPSLAAARAPSYPATIPTVGSAFFPLSLSFLSSPKLKDDIKSSSDPYSKIEEEKKEEQAYIVGFTMAAVGFAPIRHSCRMEELTERNSMGTKGRERVRERSRICKEEI